MARSSNRKRQARLAFTPLPSSSPVSKGYNQQIRDRAATVTLGDTSSPAKKRRLRGPNAHSNEDGAMMPTPDASLGYDAETIEDSNNSDSGRRSSPGSLRTSNSYRSRQQHIDFSRSRDPSSFDSPIRLSSSNVPPSSRSGMFRTSGQPRLIAEDSSEESDSDTNLPSSTWSVGAQKQNVAQSPKSAIEHSENDEIVVSKREAYQPQISASAHFNEDDEEEDMPVVLGQRKRARKYVSLDDDSSGSPTQAADSDSNDDDVVIVEGPKRIQEDDQSDNDQNTDIEPVTPRRRKLKRGRLTQQEKDDLDEDLDFLGTSDVEHTRTPRDTQTMQKNARQKALEALKRRRRLGVGVGHDNGNVSQRNSESEEDDVQVMSSRQMFHEDDEDAKFLTDEDDAPLGAPEGLTLPIEFTQYASKKPKALFKFAVEWMVQKKINPAYEGNDELYQLTFKKLDDEVRALAGSKFTSSAWTSEFTMALEARPELAYEALDRTSAEHFFRDRCDACNRGSHPATFEIRFTGEPYDHESLEEVANDDEDEGGTGTDIEENDSDSSMSRENDNKPSYDERGREIVPASTKFFVGKFCMANAQTAHSLRHWRYHLNEWVITWLIGHGYCSPEKVVERDSWNTRKRRRYANKIVDRMEVEGTVKELWRSFRNNTNEARNSRQGRFAGTDLD